MDYYSFPENNRWLKRNWPEGTAEEKQFQLVIDDEFLSVFSYRLVWKLFMENPKGTLKS